MSKKSGKKITRPNYVKPAPKKHVWTPQEKKWLIIGSAALAVIILALVIYFTCIYSDGSIRVSGDKLVGAQDNWLVTNLGKSGSSNKKYYKLAEVESLEGFTVDPTQSTKSDLSTDFYMIPDDESSPYSYLYVSGVSKLPADIAKTAYDSYLSYYPDSELGDITTETLSGYDVTYFTAKGPSTNSETGVVTYSQQMVLYIPGPRSTSILVSVYLSGDSESAYVPFEDMKALIERQLPLITLEAEK